MPEEQPAPLFERVYEWLRTHFSTLLLVAGGAMVLWSITDTTITVPRWVKVMGLTMVLLSPFGWWSGRKIVSWLYHPHWVYIVDLDTREVDNALYRVPNESYADFEVTDGEVDRVSPTLVFAQDVDLEEQTMAGVWRGTKSDRELMADLATVHELRGRLEEDAQRGFAIESQAWMIVRSATHDAVRSIANTFSAGTLPDEGEQINEAIEDAIDAFEFVAFEEDSTEPESEEIEFEMSDDWDGLEDMEVPADD